MKPTKIVLALFALSVAIAAISITFGDKRRSSHFSVRISYLDECGPQNVEVRANTFHEMLDQILSSSKKRTKKFEKRTELFTVTNGFEGSFAVAIVDKAEVFCWIENGECVQLQEDPSQTIKNTLMPTAPSGKCPRRQNSNAPPLRDE